MAGFDRVVQIFQNEMEAGKRTALIKKEYGLGGASWPVDGMGLHGYDTYGSQGIRFQWRDEQGEAEGTLSWRHIPKGTNFDRKTKKDIQKVEDWLNNYPRPMFGGRSSQELYEEEMRLII